MQTHNGQALSVSAVAQFISKIISSNLAPLWIKGEVSNLKIQQNGNVYLNIKDSEAKLNAIIMANSKARKMAATLKDGLEILIYGRISYYKKEGNCSVFIEEIELLGEGLLKQKYDELKRKLEQEGLFSRDRKKRIPEFPRWVGVVTSPTGAAIQDILNVTNRRFGSVNIVVFPAAVQGDCAASEIAAAIKVANKYAKNYIDVLIVGRGGGSIEDLWCFNEETVARAIAASEIPIISAVGHEIDYTIADYVADMRAPTPSAAAELVVKDRKEILKYIDNLKNRLTILFENKLENYKKIIELHNRDYFKKYLENLILDSAMSIHDLDNRMENCFQKQLDKIKASILLNKEKLEALNPQSILKRGFSLTYTMDSAGNLKPLTRADTVKQGEKIKTRLSDGWIDSVVSQ